MRKHVVFTAKTVISCTLQAVEDRGVQKNILVCCFCLGIIRRRTLIGGKNKTYGCLTTLRMKMLGLYWN